MKRLLTFLILIILPALSFSQKTETTFYDKAKIYYPATEQQLQEISDYRNDSLNGESIGFAENGNVVFKKHYTHGKLNGTSEGFYENGKTKDKSFYLNGLQEGEFITYYKDS